MFCSKCGTKVEDGSVFCSECGNKLDQIIKPAAEVKAEEEAKKKAEEEAKKKAEEEAKKKAEEEAKKKAEEEAKKKAEEEAKKKAEEEAKKKAEEEAKKKAEEEAKKKAEEEAKKKAEEEAKKKAEEEAKKKAEEEAKKKAEEEAKKKAEEEAKKKAEEEAKKKAEENKPAGNPVLGSKPAGNPVLGNKPAGNPVLGDKPAGNPVLGNKPAGNPVLGNKPAADSVLGNKPAVNKNNAVNKAPEQINNASVPIKTVHEPMFSFNPGEQVGGLNKINFEEDDINEAAGDKAKEAGAPVKESANIPVKENKTVASNSTAGDKPKKKSAAPIIILIIIIFLLIGVGGGAAYYYFFMDTDNKEVVEEDQTADKEEEDKDEEKKKDKEKKEKEEEEVVEEKVDVKAIYNDYMAGNMTASYEGNDYTFAELLDYVMNLDGSFCHDIVILGYESAQYAFEDIDGDEVEEFVITTVSTTGLESGNPNYMVVKYDNDKLNVVKVVVANPTGTEADEDQKEFENISFADIDSNYWTKISVNADAMNAYYEYLHNNIKDNMDKTLGDVLGDNHIVYHFVLAKGNDIPLLIFRDSEEKFPAAVIVYYNEMIVRSVFFEKWTFTTVEEGSVGGMYNNCVYTSKSPWGLDEGAPKDMVFYTIDLNTFLTSETNKVVILASEEDFNGVGKYNDYESYIKAANKDFPDDEYRYFYTYGDTYADEDGNAYDSFEAICRLYGSDENYTVSQGMDIN